MTRWQTNIYALSPWSGVVMEKVLVAEVVKKFIAIYVVRQFIAVRPMAVNSPSHHVVCTPPWEAIKIASKETIPFICGNSQVVYYFHKFQPHS